MATTAKKSDRIVALQRKDFKRRQSLIKKLDKIHQTVSKIKSEKYKPTVISDKMLKKALYHIETAMLCLQLY